MRLRLYVPYKLNAITTPMKEANKAHVRAIQNITGMRLAADNIGKAERNRIAKKAKKPSNKSIPKIMKSEFTQNECDIILLR